MRKTSTKVWYDRAAPETKAAVIKSIGRGRGYFANIMNGKITVNANLAIKIKSSIKEHCPKKSEIVAGSIMTKQDVKDCKEIAGE